MQDMQVFTGALMHPAKSQGSVRSTDEGRARPEAVGPNLETHNLKIHLQPSTLHKRLTSLEGRLILRTSTDKCSVSGLLAVEGHSRELGKAEPLPV
jgi:hypothetical protein